MNRHRFALAPVLRVRRIQEDLARLELVGADRDVAEADATLEEALVRYQDRPTGDVGPSAHWQACRLGAQRAAATVMAAGFDSEAARARMEERRSDLRVARMRTSALERLEERRHEEHAHEVRRLEEAEVDELVTGRHGRTS